MPISEASNEALEYRIVLVLPASRKILAVKEGNDYRLPTVSIPPLTRTAEQLQIAVRAVWTLHVMILDFLQGTLPCAVAEVLESESATSLTQAPIRCLQPHQLSEEQLFQLVAMLDSGSNIQQPFSRIGWIDEAINWLEAETGRRLSSKSDIQQFNASGQFALLRFQTTDGSHYWLKATGEPNAHEPSITRYLSELCPGYLPTLISYRPTWNAWLSSGEDRSIAEMPGSPLETFTLLEDVVKSMATVQMKTQGHRIELLAAGAFNQRIDVFRDHSAALFDYLEEAMSRQVSTKAAPLDNSRLREIRRVFDVACAHVESLGLPDTVVHGDMNRGNILKGTEHCQFIDWCEAYVGNPLITLEHLLLLNNVANAHVHEFMNDLLKRRYWDIWAMSHDPHRFEKSLVYMPILAIASTLYGRGGWLNSPERNTPRRQSYARTLARCMDRAAQDPALLEALCH